MGEYVVINSGTVMWQAGPDRVLWINQRRATAFRTLKAAKDAIARTKSYAADRGLDWRESYFIKKLQRS